MRGLLSRNFIHKTYESRDLYFHDCSRHLSRTFPPSLNKFHNMFHNIVHDPFHNIVSQRCSHHCPQHCSHYFSQHFHNIFHYTFHNMFQVIFHDMLTTPAIEPHQRITSQNDEPMNEVRLQTNFCSSHFLY